MGVSGAFNIKQKLPSKMYVGISPLDTFDIQFTTSQEYNSVLEHFEKINITSDSRFLGIKEFLLEFLKKNGYKSGFKISLLVESQQGLGTGYISLAMSLLAVAVYLFTGKLEKKMLRKYDQFLASEVFKEILDFSKKLVDIPTNGNVYGANNYVVFSNTSQPQVYNQI
ncbi:hypothetical protein FACS189428_3830 [Clostridia bacterium]|nr:hypothetical protein FACS189428_3830 [Clostridia bacterium]